MMKTSASITIRWGFLLLLAIISAVKGTFTLPPSFEGTWVGSPQFTALGPLDSYSFSVTAVENGDYLFENNLVYDGYLTGWQRFYVEGQSDEAGELWYCGLLRNFTSHVEEAGASIPDVFAVQSQSDTHVTWCLDTNYPGVTSDPFPTGCELCECANWTLALLDTGNDTAPIALQSTMTMAGAPGHTHSHHLSVTLSYAGPPPPLDFDEADWPGHGANFSCDFDGRDGVPVDNGGDARRVDGEISVARPGGGASGGSASGCPFLRSRGNSSSGVLPKPPAGHPAKQPAPGLASVPASGLGSASALAPTSGPASVFEHCYTLNRYSGFDLAWTLRVEGRDTWLDVEASADVPGPDSWVALGFRPLSRKADPEALDPLGTGRGSNFGMSGADIAVGYGPGSSSGSSSGGGSGGGNGGGDGAVRALYAALYTGPPQAPDPPESALELFNASASYTPSGGSSGVRGSGGGGRLALRFTRAAAGTGHLAFLGLPPAHTTVLSPWADIIWAVGRTAGDDDASAPACAYHENTRGLRPVDWRDPTPIMADAWECAA